MHSFGSNTLGEHVSITLFPPLEDTLSYYSCNLSILIKFPFPILFLLKKNKKKEKRERKKSRFLLLQQCENQSLQLSVENIHCKAQDLINYRMTYDLFTCIYVQLDMKTRFLLNTVQVDVSNSLTPVLTLVCSVF